MGFYAGWNVTSPKGNHVYSHPIQLHFCRDGAFHGMTRAVTDHFERVVGRPYTGKSTQYQNQTQDMFMHWCKQHAEDIRIESTTYVVTDNRAAEAWIREYTVPRAIEKLKNKYPTLQFEPSEYDYEGTGSRFGGRGPDARLIPGIKITGGSDVAPAFYWATMIIRAALSDYDHGKTNWSAVNKLLERYGDDDHLALWEKLRAGGQAPSWYLLATGNGPMTSHGYGVERGGISAWETRMARVDVTMPEYNVEM
jgi:hypothetical protein